MRSTFTGILFALTMLAVLALFAVPASATHLSMKQLKAQLQRAKAHQRLAVEEEKSAKADLTAALALRNASPTPVPTEDDVATGAIEGLLADGVVTDEEIAALKQVVAAKHRAAVYWTAKAKALQKRVQRREQIVRWNQRGQWWPLIKLAGARYHVNSASLRHMMMLESGGNRHSSGSYHGLFQYAYSTWGGGWNPWRHHSVYDGWAQIRATAYALHKGMGPSQWPNTYRMSF